MTPLNAPMTDVFRRRNGQTVLVLIIVPIFLVLINGLVFILFLGERAEILNINRIKAENHAQLLAEHASGQFQAADLTLLAALSEIEHPFLTAGGTPKDFDDLIRNRVLFFPMIENVLVLDRTGSTVYQLNEDEDRPADFILRRVFRIHRDGWVQFHLEHTPDPARPHRERVIFSRSISLEGDFAGVLMAVIDTALIFRRYQDHEATNIHMAVLFDRERNIVVGWHPDEQEAFSAYVRDILPDLAALNPSADALIGGLHSHENPRAIVGICQLEDFPFYMGIAYDKNVLLAGWRKKATFAGFGAGGLTLLMLFMTGAAHQHNRRRRDAETELLQVRERSRLTHLMREIAVSANKAKEFEEAIASALELICRFSECAAGWALMLRDGRSGNSRAVKTIWCDPADEGAAFKKCVDRPPAWAAELIPAIQDLALREPLCIPVLGRSLLPASLLMEETGYRSCALAPVMRDSERVAVLAFFSDQPIAKEGFLMGSIRQSTTLLGQVADRLFTREKLAESERRFRTYFELGAIGMAIMAPDRRWIDINSRFCDMLGYSRDEILHTTWVDLTHPDDISDSLQHYADIRAGKTEGFTIEKRYIRKDGETVYARVASKCIRLKDGTIDYIMLLAQDITLRKQAQQERDKLRIQLQQAQKMEAIGTLAGGIAHDFNNILFPILGYAELSMDTVPEDSETYGNLEEIYRSTLRARDLVQQILAFSRQTTQERKPLKMQRVIKEVLKLLRSTLPADIGIIQNLSADGHRVLADPTQIHQVIMNLCTNAYHAMRETGGTLTVGLTETRIPPGNSQEDSKLVPGDYLALTVADTGHGIDRTLLDRIFDPYFTTKKTGEGTGLGLSVVHGIIKSYQGDIRVESKPGKGTTFTILLPVAPAEEALPAPSDDSCDLIQGGTERILLVDDEAPILRMISQMLSQLGYTVTTRSGSLEGLEAFRADPRRFDLVITDMAMPNMTGIALSRELRTIRPNIPIILCTGFSEIVSEEKAASLGIQGFILKPVLRKELAKTIRKILASENQGQAADASKAVG